jgi:tetratricopeptide (TPR) repeat protein
MTSRLIERLDQEIAVCRDPLERECLKAERAGALARHGLLDDARFNLAGVRAQNLRLHKPRLSAWVALVEGLIDHFDSLRPDAVLKFERAYKFAQEACDDGLQAQALAWMATGSFNASDMEAMIHQLGRAVRLAPRQHHAAWARIGLVLADAYRFAGDDMRSQHWYNRARQAAGHEGDASMMSAFLHNVSAMRSAVIGLEDAFGRADLAAARRAWMEAESSANYDDGAGSEALVAMSPVVRAQLLVVLGRFDEALALFDTHLMRASAEGMASRGARFLADRAWCLLQLGRLAEAQEDAQAAQSAVMALRDVDDLAAVHARLAQICQGLGLTEPAQAHQQQADAALAIYRSEQESLQQALNAVFSRIV